MGERQSEKKAAAKKQRVRPTNKSIESQRFTTVKLPKSSEVVAQSKIHELDQRSGNASSAFDPIPNDGMFVVVENSQYWPPPSVEDVMRSVSDGQLEVGNDGMDMYDRRADDAAAKAAKLKVVKTIGEVNHPRGKARKNAAIQFNDNDDD